MGYCNIVKDIIHKNKKSLCQPKFKLPDGEIISDKKIISEKFNDFFVNVGHKNPSCWQISSIMLQGSTLTVVRLGIPSSLSIVHSP